MDPLIDPTATTHGGRPLQETRDEAIYKALTELFNEFDVMGYDFAAQAVDRVKREFWPGTVSGEPTE